LKPEVIIPKDEAHWKQLRALDLTSTTVPALFGCSPYLTEFELYHRLRDKVVVDIEDNERMKWGNRLEAAIATGIAEDLSLKIRPMKEYMRIPELGLGSSFDYAIEGHGDASFLLDKNAGLLEVKNVDSLAFRDGWLMDDETGEIEAPPHIEIQVQVQLAVSGRGFAKIGALVGGNRVVVLERERDQQAIDAILTRTAAFRKRLESGQAPEPDYARDAEFLISLHQRATEGKVKDVSEDAKIAALATLYKSYAETASEADRQKQAVKAQILERIGDASKAVGSRFTISAGTVKGGAVSYVREDYRNFRINWKKEK
jgi:predicted phage-related endonuclease